MAIDGIRSLQNAYQGSMQSVDNTPKVAETENFDTNPEVQAVQTQYKDSSQQNPSDPNGGKKGQSGEASDAAIKKAVEDINKKSAATEAIFGYHEGTKRVTIKIVDKETKEVKKEYPAEETLDLIQKAWEMAGLMVDEKR